MRGFGGVLVVLACCAFVPAAFAGDSEFAGDWEVKMERQGQTRVSTISIVEADGGLSGSWASERDTTELSDVKAADGKLTFVRKMERQGQEFEINYEASIVDGNLVGKMITPRGEREFMGTAVSAEPTFFGSWDIKLELQGQVYDASLDVTEKDGKLGGHWSSQLGESDLEDIKIEDGELTFSRTVEAQGQELALDYAAKLEDGKLAGTISSSMGEMPFTGTLVKKADDAPAGGTEAERAAAMVKQLDGNDDGHITEDEAPEQMKQFFAMIDSNGDGHIDATEMIAVIQFMDQQ